VHKVTEGPLFLTARDCQRLLSPADVLAEIERVLIADAEGTVRWPTPRNLNIAPDSFGNDYHAKSCVLEYLPVGGFRLVSHPLDEASRLSTRLVVLVDGNTMPLAIVDESWSYLQRTVGSVALASRKLAADEPRTLALVGAGRLAATALKYYAHYFTLHDVRIASRRPETRSALAQRASERYGLSARGVDSVEEAVQGAQLVLTCTSSGQAVLEESWVAPGAVVAALSTAEPGRDLAEQADLLVVDSREQLQKELVAEFGPDAPDWVDATVGEIVTGKHPGRTAAHQRVLIITEGMAHQDIALAYRAYQRALESGTGLSLPMAEAEED
jgi:ornithine cyclodeaminase/alanine dehydrogenase-like protein (mu-crystallin family)